MDELEELFNYSRSSMSRITTLSNSYLENFGLELFSKAYTGLYISGNEISIRDCMYHLLEKTEEEEIWNALDIREVQERDIRKWMERCFKKYGLCAKEKEEQQFFKLRSKESLLERRFTLAIWLIWTEKSRSKHR